MVKKPFVTERRIYVKLILLPSKIRQRKISKDVQQPLLVCQALQALGDSVARVEATEKPILIIGECEVLPFALGHL